MTLGKTLRGLSADLHKGKGFFVLRGFPVDSLSREDCIICYTGVSSYVGSMRGWQDQNKLGVVHIKDLSALQAVGTATFTNEKQVFHTDNGDIVSLLALEVAPAGGWSKISSSWHVYNEMAKKRPDLIRTLAEPWPHDRYDMIRQNPILRLAILCPLLNSNPIQSTIQYDTNDPLPTQLRRHPSLLQPPAHLPNL